MNSKNLNEFNVDYYRDELANSNRKAELKETYNNNYPSLKESDSTLKWNKHAQINDTSSNPITLQRISVIYQLFSKYRKRKVSVLDFGFGYADIVKKILNESSFEYLGIDISDVFVKEQSVKFEKYSNINFKKKNLFDIETQFDMIFSLEVLEHIEPVNLFAILRKLSELLKDDGYLIVSVPLYEDLAKISNYCSGCGRLENPNGHIRSYTPSLIQIELDMAGFEIVEVRLIKFGYGFLNKLRFLLKFVLGRFVGKPVIASNAVIVAKKK